MTSTTCLLATLAAVLMIPALFLAWLTESRTERIQRRVRDGWTRKAIAAHEGITIYRVRKALAA